MSALRTDPDALFYPVTMHLNRHLSVNERLLGCAAEYADIAGLAASYLPPEVLQRMADNSEALAGLFVEMNEALADLATDFDRISGAIREFFVPATRPRQ